VALGAAKVAHALACDIVVRALRFVVTELVATVAFYCNVGVSCKKTRLLYWKVVDIVLNFYFVIRLGVLFTDLLLRVLMASKPSIWRDYIWLTAC